jgi:transposase
MAALFHLELGLGTVPALEQQVSAALAQPVQEAQTYLRQQPVNNVDETSWREGSKRHWLWINTTPAVTVFALLAGRGATQARQVLGADFAGIVGSDRYSAYNWLDPHRRALCWAHLERDFQALEERGGESARVGQALLEQSEQLFHRWYQVKAGTLSRADLPMQMAPIRARVGELLREGAAVGHDKTCRTCANLLKLEPALWTFVWVEGVEPTNNGAERPLRRAVLWRRKSFGTQSAAGSRFVERVLTAVTTLRQQGRDVLDYLTTACRAAVQGGTPPSLLPVSPPVGAIA